MQIEGLCECRSVEVINLRDDKWELKNTDEDLGYHTI